MLRNVKVTDTEGVFYCGKHYPAGETISVPESLAAIYKDSGKGEVQPVSRPVNVVGNPLIEAVDPLVPNADPLHSARNLSAVIEDHPGLIAHGDATGAPRRTGRMVPDATATVDVIPDPAKAVKPVKS